MNRSLFSLQGKTALITGASRGLGRHFALTLSKAGANVVLTARDANTLHSLSSEIGHSGGQKLALGLDVCDRASVTAALDQAWNHFGAIDVLVNNAGISAATTALEQTEEHWQQVLETNLSGAWRLSQENTRRLIESEKGGSIINIASILGFRVAGNTDVYAASKAALIQLTKAWALEWARYDIRVNAIAPGYIETDINREYFNSPAGAAMIKRIPQRQLGKAEDLDGALLLLASEASRYITGSTIVVDGGHLVSSL